MVYVRKNTLYIDCENTYTILFGNSFIHSCKNEFVVSAYNRLAGAGETSVNKT